MNELYTLKVKVHSNVLLNLNRNDCEPYQTFLVFFLGPAVSYSDLSVNGQHNEFVIMETRHCAG